MLRCIGDISFEVPLGSNIVSTFFGSLIISLRQEIPYLLYIHVRHSLIQSIPITTPVKIIWIRSDVIRIATNEIWIIFPEVWIVIYIYRVIPYSIIVRPSRRTGTPSIPIIQTRITVIAYIGIDAIRGGRHGIHSRRLT
ncbi:unnamed protein product [Chrysodeixis includens]|uniref:Uncharacterized protein n=1 Tax=Chrysodeixis includens TaxID=689277 RepID=A0A9N8L2A4_CHRIL|nr:unnamed protein product [Chrysodeixis includens]